MPALSPTMTEGILQKWLIKIGNCWCNSQRMGEYIPLHIHSECSISTIMYLKVPKFLPSIYPVGDDDGCITFLTGTKWTDLSDNLLKLKPKVGDFFIFPWCLTHTVAPFSCKGTRISVAANFTLSEMGKDGNLEKIST